MDHPLIIVNVDAEHDYFIDLMEQWGEEISKIFPHYDDEEATDSDIFILQSEQKSIGVFIAQKKGDELHVHVDYVLPDYRNMGVGNDFFNQKINEFKVMGMSIIVALTDNLIHQTYLIELGFKNSTLHPDRFELQLK